MKSIEQGVRAIATALDENLPKDVTFYMAMYHDGQFTIVTTLDDELRERVSFLNAVIRREVEAAREKVKRQ